MRCDRFDLNKRHSTATKSMPLCLFILVHLQKKLHFDRRQQKLVRNFRLVNHYIAQFSGGESFKN